MKKYAAVICSVILVGCATPGSTIDLVQSNASSVSLEYTHSYSFELGETVKRAQFYCEHYGRNAEMVSNTPVNLDRSLATFRCVKP